MLRRSYQSRRRKKENEAIKKMNKNPNYFYSYANRFSKSSSEIGDLITKEGLVLSDPFEKAEVFRKQYESVPSQPMPEYGITNPNQFFDCQDDGYSSQEELEEQSKGWRNSSQCRRSRSKGMRSRRPPQFPYLPYLSTIRPSY